MKILNKKSKEEQLRQQQNARKEEQLNLTADINANVDPDYVSQMVESELEPATARMLANLMSRDWVLSKMSDAEVHEARWLARTIMDEVEAMHPSEDSIWTGEFRKYASGDGTENLSPLSSQAKTEIFQFIQGYTARVARSKGGFQQETFKKQIRKSERENRSDDEDGGWF